MNAEERNNMDETRIRRKNARDDDNRVICDKISIVGGHTPANIAKRALQEKDTAIEMLEETIAVLWETNDHSREKIAELEAQRAPEEREDP